MIKRTVNLFLGDKCNLSCEYCTETKNKGNEFDLEKFINFSIKNKEYIDETTLYITGGEPTLYLNKNIIEELLKYYENIKVTTNFIEDIDYLLKYGGRVRFIVSYHEWDKHDKCLYGKTLRYREYIDCVAFVLNNNTYRYLGPIIEHCKEGFIPIKIIPEMQYGKSIDTVNKENLKDMFKYYYNHEIYKNIIENFKIGKVYDECHLHKIVYGWDNNLYPCRILSDMYYNEFNGEHKIGNWETELKNIDDTYINFNPIKSYDGTSCSECGKCGGNICNYFSGVNNGIVSENMCEFYRMIDEIVKEKSDTYRFNFTTVMAILTRECNMRCKYCYQENKPIHSEKMSKDTMKSIIDTLHENYGERKIVLFGGEPTLDLDVVEYAVDYVKSIGDNMEIELETNLLYINDRIIDIYKKAANSINFILAVSIDGIKSVHDESRIDIHGNGTFDKVTENLNKIKLLIPNIRISVHSVMSKYLINNGLYESLVYLINNYEKGLYTYLSVSPVTSDTTEDALTDEECEIIYNTYYKLIDDGYDKSLIRNLFGTVIFELYNNTECDTCDAGKYNVAVMPNGDISVCHRYIEDYKNYTVIGNINNFNPIISRESEYYKKYIKQEFINSVKNFEGYDCNNCKINKFCHICIGGNEMRNGDIGTNSEQKCLTSIRLASAYAKIKTLRELEKINKNLEVLTEMNKFSIKGQAGLTEYLLNKLENIEEGEPNMKRIVGGGFRALSKLNNSLKNNKNNQSYKRVA